MKLQFKLRMTTILILLLCGFSFCSDAGKENNGEKPPEKEKPVIGDVILFITTNTRSQDFKREAIDFSERDNMSPTTLKLEPNTRYQTMDGFGAAVTGSSAYNLMQMTQENRTKFLKETFSETEGMGQSYIRISIGCSDFSLSEYTCCDTPGIENFGLTTEETEYVIPILKEILAINPDVKVMGSPWTPPRRAPPPRGTSSPRRPAPGHAMLPGKRNTARITPSMSPETFAWLYCLPPA